MATSFGIHNNCFVHVVDDLEQDEILFRSLISGFIYQPKDVAYSDNCNNAVIQAENRLSICDFVLRRWL